MKTQLHNIEDFLPIQFATNEDVACKNKGKDAQSLQPRTYKGSIAPQPIPLTAQRKNLLRKK